MAGRLQGWVKQAGLTGGELLPGAPPGSGFAPLYAAQYEPIALWHPMFSGVFERHPSLQLVLTETAVDWAPGALANLDGFAPDLQHPAV